MLKISLVGILIKNGILTEMEAEGRNCFSYYGGGCTIQSTHT